MNKRIALVLSFVMLFTAFMPVYTSAAGDAGLEDAIKRVKEFFPIPDSMKDFYYSANTSGDKKVWNLNWNSKEEMGGSISATVNSEGDILSFNQYSYVDYGSIKKLPKISRQEAKAVAEGIINKLNPGILKELKISEETVQSINDETYYFNYTRLYNGIPFPANYINVYINRQTGELQSYNKSWTKDGNFPSNDKAISIDKAQEAYIKNLGLRLTYNVAFKNDEMRIYPAFTPIYNTNYYIDAFTGERINLNYFYGVRAGGNTMGLTKEAAMKDEAQIVLSPEEIKAIDEVSNLLDQDEAEKIARSLSILGLDDSYKVGSAGLNRSWPVKKDFVWNFYFQKESKGEEEDYYPVYVSLNAKTGEIISFNAANANKPDEKAKYDKTASKEAVDKFLTDFAPLKYNEIEYEEANNDIVMPDEEGEAPKTYSFSYVRKVDGIPFPDNGINVLYDAVSGKVISYNLNWYSDVEFPSTKEAISIDKVYESFFSNIGLELQYYMGRSDIIYAKMAGVEPDVKEEIKLVYAVKKDKPVSFDLNGAILDYDGEPYKEKKAVEYKDISGHYAE
ncbi:MAG: peptidase M4, partial [Clostridiaceae bacterium]|nr:peptidase M4 [Clostridiaceae bacterium]